MRTLGVTLKFKSQRGIMNVSFQYEGVSAREDRNASIHSGVNKY